MFRYSFMAFYSYFSIRVVSAYQVYLALLVWMAFLAKGATLDLQVQDRTDQRFVLLISQTYHSLCNC